MIEQVLFDLDGTLVDTAPDLSNALNAIRAQQNLPPLPLSMICPTVSLGGNAMIKLAFGLTESDDGFTTIRDQFLTYYHQHIAEKSTLYDGITELLTALENDNKSWGIVTNKSTWLTLPLLEALTLDQRAACIVCGDTTAYSKPHPAPLLHACELINAEPTKTLYIGDAHRDIEAGKRASMKTMVALYGYIEKNQDPINWGADSMVERADQISSKIHTLCTK